MAGRTTLAPTPVLKMPRRLVVLRWRVELDRIQQPRTALIHRKLEVWCLERRCASVKAVGGLGQAFVALDAGQPTVATRR